jgi:hypothetical protein
VSGPAEQDEDSPAPAPAAEPATEPTAEPTAEPTRSKSGLLDELLEVDRRAAEVALTSTVIIIFAFLNFFWTLAKNFFQLSIYYIHIKYNTNCFAKWIIREI